jgi:hypothetical protein
MTEALNSFFGPGKTAKPTPPPEPMAVEKKSPPKQQPFSFLQATSPKPAPQAVPKTSPVPARKSPTLTIKAPATLPPKEVVVVKKPAPTFSFFKQATTPEPAPVVPKPSPVPVRKPSPTLSLFKAKEPATPPPKPPVTAEAKKSVQGSGTFSLFGGGPKAAPPAPKAPVVVEEKKAAQRSGTFSLFSAPGTRSIAKAQVVEKKAVVAKQTVAIAAPGKAAPVADDVPVIGKFKQNADGSITGIVRNSKTFRTGTEITTSPVPRGAKAGTVVTTSSGSKYRLE